VTGAVPVSADRTLDESHAGLAAFLRAAFLGGGSIVLAAVLLVAGAYRIVTSRPERFRVLIAQVLDQVEAPISGGLDRSIPADDRQAFREAYARFRAEFSAGRIPAGNAGPVFRRLIAASRHQPVPPPELRELIFLLRRLAPPPA